MTHRGLTKPTRMVQFHNFEAKINWEREGHQTFLKYLTALVCTPHLRMLEWKSSKSCMCVHVHIIISQSKVTPTIVTLSSSVVHLGIA